MLKKWTFGTMLMQRLGFGFYWQTSHIALLSKADYTYIYIYIYILTDTLIALHFFEYDIDNNNSGNNNNDNNNNTLFRFYSHRN